MGNENKSPLNGKQSNSKNYYEIDQTIKASAYKIEEEILSKFCSELGKDQVYFEDVSVTIKNYENII